MNREEKTRGGLGLEGGLLTLGWLAVALTKLSEASQSGVLL